MEGLQHCVAGQVEQAIGALKPKFKSFFKDILTKGAKPKEGEVDTAQSTIEDAMDDFDAS